MIAQPQPIPVPALADRRWLAEARRRLRWLMAPMIAALLLLIGALPAGAAPPANDVGPDRVYFPATGHYLAYGFLDYWHHYGDLRIFGYPISEEFTDPATGLTVQYFERAVFEWHPDATRAWRVQLRRLGADLSIARQDQAPFKLVTAASDANCSYFPQTSHRLCFGFRAFWN